MEVPPPRFIDAPIRTITLVEEITREERGAFVSASPPGHLLHLVCAGKVDQVADDKFQHLRPNDFVWYGGMESCRGMITQSPWRFISINFIAPQLVPPRDKNRVFRSTGHSRHLVQRLLECWRQSPSWLRSVRCHALLNELIAELHVALGGAAPPDAQVDHPETWWRIERDLRSNMESIPALPAVAKKAGLSLRSLTRVCREATGLAPGQRIKMIRLAHARQLLQLTELSITEIAFTSGYPRVQELSRDMRKHFGQSPREVRSSAPDYKRLQGV